MARKKAADPWYWARINLTRRYGITVEQLQAMIRTSKGRCAICQRKPKRGRLVVDHDHSSGRVRGLLCRSCNYCMGGFKDSPELMRRAARYLEKGSNGS